MNLFDFDKTVYLHDSTLRFYLHCLKRKPYIILRLPVQLFALMLWKLNIKDKLYFKEHFFSFLRSFKDINSEVELFWRREKKYLCRWFSELKTDGDTVVSASPEFLLAPICRELGVGCIATAVDPSNGKFLSPNCYGEEKPVRLAASGITRADAAYSDSLSDLPMLRMATRGYTVKNKNTESVIMTEVISARKDEEQ